MDSSTLGLTCGIRFNLVYNELEATSLRQGDMLEQLEPQFRVMLSLSRPFSFGSSVQFLTMHGARHEMPRKICFLVGAFDLENISKANRGRLPSQLFLAST